VLRKVLATRVFNAYRCPGRASALRGRRHARDPADLAQLDENRPEPAIEVRPGDRLTWRVRGRTPSGEIWQSGIRLAGGCSQWMDGMGHAIDDH